MTSRSGKTEYLRQLARQHLAIGKSVAVVTPDGIVDGAKWLADHDRGQEDGMKIYRISDNISELLGLLTNERGIFRASKAAIKALHERAQAAGAAAGLDHQGERLGMHAVATRDAVAGPPTAQSPRLPTEIILDRRSMYALAPRYHECEVAEHLARAIADKHGPGRWWSSGGCAGYCDDDDLGVRGGDLGGQPYVLLRAYYFHDSAGGSLDEHNGPCDPDCRTCAKERQHVSEKLVEQLRKEQDAAINKHIDEAHARRMGYLAEPVRVRTPAGDITIRADPALRPGEIGQRDAPKPVDPLDVEYDGTPLRKLLESDADASREGWAGSRSRRRMTPAQRLAVSAHWSAELRAKVAASTAADKAREPRVMIAIDAEDLPWR